MGVGISGGAPSSRPMLQYEFEESVGYWLAVAHHSYFRAFTARLAPLGITYRQAQILGWLALERQLTQADLASRMLVEPPSLVGVLDRMERSGWITREACAADRRKKWIRALPAATAIWEQIADCGREQRAQATAGMQPHEAATLRHLLQKLMLNLREGEGAPEVGAPEVGAADAGAANMTAYPGPA